MPSSRQSSRGLERDRLRIAQTAARLMGESGSRDIGHARHKAARLLGLNEPAALPDETLVSQALDEYLRLFAPASRRDEVQAKREAAMQAMTFFDSFSPRLVGPVLDGSADARSAIQLHLHCDEPEAVQRFLEDQRIPARQTTRRVRLQRDTIAALVCWHLDADGMPFELLVLPRLALRQAPLQMLDGKPMQRASLAQLHRQAGPQSGDG